MTQCLGKSDVEELAKATLSDFDQDVATLSPDLCAPFNRVAMRLEAELLTIYRVVVQIVRKEDDLERIADWWDTMMAQCDLFAERLSKLSRHHPECGAERFYNKVLDLRNKCQRLREMHK